jgi:hypothetical protein
MPLFPMQAAYLRQSLSPSGFRLLRVLRTDPTPGGPSALLLILSVGLPVSQREPSGPPKFLCASLDTCHALRGPRQTIGELTLALSLCWLLLR